MAPKPKPVAKIVAKTKRTSRDLTPTPADILKLHSHSSDDIKHNATNSLDRKLSHTKQYGSERIYDTPKSGNTTVSDLQKPLYISTSQGNSSVPGSPHSPGTYAGSPGRGGSPTGKKAPPPPPKRTNSIKSDHHPHLLRKSHSGNTSLAKSAVSDSGMRSQSQYSPSHRPAKDSTPPRPPLPHNYVSSNAHVHAHAQQQQPMAAQYQNQNGGGGSGGGGGQYQDCVKSLSERFESAAAAGQGGGGEVGPGSGPGGRRGSSESSTSISSLASVPEPPHYTPSQNDDFPPPPPPLSTSPPEGPSGGAKHKTQHPHPAGSQSSASDTDNPLSDVIDQLQGKTTGRGPATNNHPPPQQNQPQLRQHTNNDSDGSDSDSGFESNRKSGSSIGSSACATGSTDTLPFANENVGTIKSRSQNSKPSIVTVSGEEGEERTVEVDASFFEDSGTIKRKPAKPEASAAAAAQSQQQQPQQQQQKRTSQQPSRGVPTAFISKPLKKFFRPSATKWRHVRVVVGDPPPPAGAGVSPVGGFQPGITWSCDSIT